MDHRDPCSWTAPYDGAGDRVVLARTGERLAVEHLVRAHGLVLVATNLRVSIEGLRGELDVVMRDVSSGALVVCEVKSRTGASGAGAVESLGARQRARIRRMTAALLADGALRARCVRFDLVTLDVSARRPGGEGRLGHLVGAF
jgi:putative endonuclease